MKPIDGTFANCSKWGCGGLNIDGCRIGENPGYRYNTNRNGTTFHGQQCERIKQTAEKAGKEWIESKKGRWPANVVLDEAVGEMLSERSRFFYCAKASKRDRGEFNDHPTVKPLRLCEWLAKLILPPARATPRRLLVPYSGSGSEMLGALAAGWDDVLGIELNPDYVVRKDHAAFKALSFGKLRKTAGDLVKRFSDGEVSGVFLCHGTPVPSDSLQDVYTNRPLPESFEPCRAWRDFSN